MNEATGSRRVELTRYEREQVGRIAAWKAEYPNIISELLKRATLPVARLIERIVPDDLARRAIEKVFEIPSYTAGVEDIRRRAGVQDLAQMREKPLEECDRLAKRVGLVAEGLGTLEGAATGAGGVLTTLIDIPLLFGLAIRTILRIGHCYGYPLDSKGDRAFVLGVFTAALSGTRERKRRILTRLREIEDQMLEEGQEDLILEEAVSLLTQLEIFEEIPTLGLVAGAFMNYSTLHRASITARHVFQERWLRDQGKVHVIEPAPDCHPRYARPGWSGAMARAVYSSGYYIAFGASFPVYFFGSALSSFDNPILRGIRDGAAAATNRVAEFHDARLEINGSRVPDLAAIPA